MFREVTNYFYKPHGTRLIAFKCKRLLRRSRKGEDCNIEEGKKLLFFSFQLLVEKIYVSSIKVDLANFFSCIDI